MRTIEQTIYRFNELTDSAKERAREWYREGFDFSWSDESRHSIETFCAEFNVALKNYSVDPYGNYSCETNVTHSTFRGMKLSQFNREEMPTGYCMDSTLRYTFADVWKRNGDPLAAFNASLDMAFKEWRDDMEYQLSDESVDENIVANEYEFFKSGKHYS